MNEQGETLPAEDASDGSKRRSAIDFARQGAAGPGADPFERAHVRRAATTSGWNFSATGCSASASPNCCSTPSATADEGELSVRLNQLVSAETCAEVADELGLHDFIRTGADVKKLTGKRMLNVRADVVESLIAAIYLDGGLEAARRFILRYWSEPRRRAPMRARRDAKTELQEWAHAAFAVTPHYRVDDRSGPDHDPRFTVTVEIAGVAPETGVERSKRAAEQVAATQTARARRRLAESRRRRRLNGRHDGRLKNHR